MNRQPYIGITGFTRRSDLLDVISHWNRHFRRQSRRLFFGILVTPEIVSGKAIPTGRYSDLCDLPKACPDAGSVQCIAHLTSISPVRLTEDASAIIRSIRSETGSSGGMQFNAAWPDPRSLERFRSDPEMKDVVLILQVGSRALKRVQNSPKALAEKVAKEYLGLIDYILLDPSGGFGRDLDVQQTLDHLLMLRRYGVDSSLGLAVAGGLSADSIDRLAPIAAEFPDISIDAEGRLRDEHDRLDPVKARSYLDAACRLLSC